jgi:flagellar hook-length control protein FliK
MLAPDAALEMIAALLTKEAKGALSRQMLMQAASLPKAGQLASAQTSSAQGATQRSSASWLFELLFAAPDGPAVAQFEIDRDGEPPQDGAPDPIWRVRFSLDFAPIGPIHARISLGGGQAHVALWAENDETRSLLDAQQGDLAAALSEDDLTAQVAVFQGRPNVAPAAAGQFMNRAV